MEGREQQKKTTFWYYIKYSPFYLLSVLPFPFLYTISSVSAFLLRHIIRYRRLVVKQNLARCFPNKTVRERNQIEKKFYLHLTDVLFESIKLLTVSPKLLNKRICIANPEMLSNCINTKKNLILYASHQGNWEWLASTPAQMEGFDTIVDFYQKLSNDYFEGLVQNIRQRFGVECVLSDRGVRHLIRQKKMQKHICCCLIADQSPRPNSSYYWSTLLGQPTAFLIGVEKIKQITDATVIFLRMIKTKRGFYTITFQEMNTNGGNLVDAYADLLSQAIEKSPETWLWTHRRWKIKPTNA